ncbi:NADH-quinone oxidoreductase subunit J [Gorillibacterium sp. CAU 1737]|uniref:NADH-quinone oxidoreductase subunit J n=1 Tax=Gorillibacterium sp. CAU 1737 TaxID=3140362 RepID=UPI003260F33E
MWTSLADLTKEPEGLLFLLLAILAAGGGLSLLRSEKTSRQLTSAGVVFLSLAGIYLLLQAPVAAAFQFFWGTGAVMALTWIALTFMKHTQAKKSAAPALIHRLLAAAGALFLFGFLVLVIGKTPFAKGSESADVGTWRELLGLLFHPYAWAFGLAALLLAIAMVAAVILIRREEGGE